MDKMTFSRPLGVLILSLSIFFGCGLSQLSHAEQTTGGVNWLDPLAYTKPYFYPITYPSEADCGSAVYYVDRNSGSGTTCSQANPCAWSGLSGKAGLSGGPARIYLKGGTANMSITSGMYGSTGNEIVIMPWPGDATTSIFRSGGGYGNRIGSSSVHHIIFDGGPDMQFIFSGYGGSGQTNYNTTVAGDYITLYRCQFDNNSISGPVFGTAVGSGTYTSYTYLINCELYDASAYYGIYSGGGTGCTAGDTGHDHFYIRNNIFRDVCGRGIQIEPRDYANYTYIEGNALHDVGYGSGCRSAPASGCEIAESCGGTINYTYIRNNIFFNMGGGAAYFASSDENYVENNTVYQYANSALPAQAVSHGISCNGSNTSVIARNNIILDSQNGVVRSMDRCSFTRSNNLCDDGRCGSGQISTATTEFRSTNSDSVDFLKLKVGAHALDGGTSTVTIVTSYFRDPWETPYDIGADQYGDRPGPPSGLRIKE